MSLSTLFLSFVKGGVVEEDMVNNLLDYITKQPVWRFHGLMRALHLTGQDHVIRLLGLNPDDYEDMSHGKVRAIYYIPDVIVFVLLLRFIKMQVMLLHFLVLKPEDHAYMLAWEINCIKTQQCVCLTLVSSIGRVRKIAVEKGRPSTRQLITGVPPVTFTAGASESDHSGVLPVKIRWSGT